MAFSYQPAQGSAGYTLISDRNPMLDMLQKEYRQKSRRAGYNIGGSFLGYLGNSIGGGGGGSASGSGGSGGGGTGGYDELQSQMLGLAGQQGASQRDQINRTYDASLDSQIARLYDRGFGNSTAVESTQLESDRNRQAALTQVNDNLLGQQIGIGTQIGLAGLNAANQRNSWQFQLQNQMLGGLLGGLFG